MHLQTMETGLQIGTEMEAHHTLDPRNVKHSFRDHEAKWWQDGDLNFRHVAWGYNE